MVKILSQVGDERISNEIMLLWLAYEDGDSIEADLARQLDKLEMIIQANEYECLHPEKCLDSFFRSTTDSFRHPQVSIRKHFHHIEELGKFMFCFVDISMG